MRPALRELIEAQAAGVTGARRYERGVAEVPARERLSMSDKRFTDDEMAEIVARARTLTDMRADERRAADLLKELLVGEHAPRDTDGAPGMHDFDLRLDDGRTLAAEATTDTSRVDKAFPDQINRVSPLDVPGPTRMRHVDLATPGNSPDDQQAARARVDALSSRWLPPPDSRGRPRTRGGAQSRVARHPPTVRTRQADKTARAAHPVPRRCRGARQTERSRRATVLPVRPPPDQNPQVFLGDAPLTGATQPSMIVNAANENSPNKAGKPVNAKTARAAEAHPFPRSNSAQQHKRARPKRRPPRAMPG